MKPIPVRVLGIVANPRKEEAGRIIPELVRQIEQRGLSCLVSEEVGHMAGQKVKTCPVSELRNGVDMLIALGGDGTILATAQAIGGAAVPILGVKVGGLGFLADITPDELAGALDKIGTGEYEISERMTLETSHAGKTSLALNDVVIDKGASPRIVHLSISVAGQFVTVLTADGLIMATPTGSTAYSLSVGGPIVHPRLQAIVLSPVCPHVLANRPMVIADDEEIEVLILRADGDVKLTIDGQRHCVLGEGERVTVRKGAAPVRLVRTSSRTYYDMLRAKLKWGVREG
jgi:NAD+ kinase